MTDAKWPLWEVFVRAKNGLSHKHAGSVHAADARMAIEAARDVYTRRMEGVSLWVVPSSAIVASDPKETTDLAAQQPERVMKMTATLEAWKASVEKSLTGADYTGSDGPAPPASIPSKKK